MVLATFHGGCKAAPDTVAGTMGQMTLQDGRRPHLVAQAPRPMPGGWRRRIARRGGRSPWRRRGQALVEFALVLPVMMLILLAAIDFGRIMFSYIQITNAAREGAAYAATDPGDTADITTHALQETDAQGQYGEHTPSVSVTCVVVGTQTTEACATAPGGDQVDVAVSEVFTFLTPLMSNFFGSNFTMTASASAPIYGSAAFNPVVPTANPTPSPTPSCVAPNDVVPNLVGMTVANARGAWTSAGFSGSFSPANGLPNKTVTGQSLQPGSCQPSTSAISVTYE